MFFANDINGLETYDACVRYMSSNAMTLVSAGLNEFAATGRSSGISADGKHVAFTSDSTNLVPNHTNGYFDAFVRDLVLGQTTRKSVGYAGGDPDFNADEPTISADGRRLSFASWALNIVQGVPSSLLCQLLRARPRPGGDAAGLLHRQDDALDAAIGP